MKTTRDLLNEVRERTPKKSWYATARILGLSDSRMSQYHRGGVIMGDELAKKTAIFLGYPEEVVLLWLQCERMKDKPSFEVWQRLAQQIEHQKTAA